MVSLISLGLRNLKNGNVIKKAIELDRILLSFDRDFIILARTPHPGVVILKIHPNLDDIVIPILKKFKVAINNLKIKDTVVIIEKDKINQRQGN